MELTTVCSFGRRLADGAARERLIPLLLFFSLCASGCASMLSPQPKTTVAPAPPRPTVTFTTTTATTYYSVRGTTTSQIFEEIRAHGLVEKDGNQAAGLASANSEMGWKARATAAGSTSDGALCIPESVAITLDLVVTLPRHERTDDLSDELRQRWQHFAAAVEAHEQRHVDIFMNGATALKARIEAALEQSASCVDLETTIRRLWKNQQAETDKAQREFDGQDRERIANDRKPLQAEIDTTKARATALAAEVRELDATLEDFSRRAGAVRQKIDAINADIARSNGICSRPTDRIQRLCRQYKTLAATHDALATEHSSLVVQRNRIAGEHNTLVESIKVLTEALNWVY